MLIIELLKTSDLEDFLKEHEGEWWSPSEIRKKLGVDLRTVKNVIRRLDGMTHKSWVLDIAERGDRLYVVRMVRDIESSRSLVKSDVKGKRIRVPTSSKEKLTLDHWTTRE